MIIKEHARIVLTQDLPDDGLERGDVGTVVHLHGNGAGYEVEFVTLSSTTVAIATVLPTQLRPVGKGGLTHVREVRTTEV